MLKNAVDIFRRNVLNSELTSIATEILEVELDSLLKDGPIKDLPGISILYSLAKYGYQINERFKLKKLSKFIHNLNDIPQEDKDQFYLKINNDAEQEALFERLLLIIDGLDELEKAKISSNIFKLFVYGIISKDLMIRLLRIVKDIYLQDLMVLYYFDFAVKNNVAPPEQYQKMSDPTVKQALNFHGLITIEQTIKPVIKGLLATKASLVNKTKVTELGRQLKCAMYYSDEDLLEFKKYEQDRYCSYSKQ